MSPSEETRLMEQMWLVAGYLFWSKMKKPLSGLSSQGFMVQVSTGTSALGFSVDHHQQRQQRQQHRPPLHSFSRTLPFTQPLSSLGPTAESCTWSHFKLTNRWMELLRKTCSVWFLRARCAALLLSSTTGSRWARGGEEAGCWLRNKGRKENRDNAKFKPRLYIYVRWTVQRLPFFFFCGFTFRSIVLLSMIYKICFGRPEVLCSILRYRKHIVSVCMVQNKQCQY